MRTSLAFLFILFFIPNLKGQDSIKTDRPVILIQAYPDTTTSYAYPNGFKTGVQNGLWFSVYPIETFPPKIKSIPAVKSVDPNVQYFLREKNGNAIIVKDSINKHAFYITPITKKIKKLKKPVLELEFWVSFNSRNTYYPTRKFSDLHYRDDEGQLIESNIIWKKYNDLKNENGQLLIGTESFLVK